MIIDNQAEGKKLFEFLKANTRTGNLDIVTGFFTIAALSFLDIEINDQCKFRLVLGKIVNDESKLKSSYDFIHDGLGIDSVFTLSDDAKKAVDFLKRDNVLVKNISEKFCHAKSYIFSDDKDCLHYNYSIVGSSNLTGAGIGLSKVPNLELNVAKIGNESDFPELEKWMAKVWEQSSETIEIDERPINFKDYCVEQIKQCYVKYTPEEIYYKILYEFFSDEIDLTFEKEEESKKREKLEDSEIFKKLFEYQKKGALSLISMLNKYNGAILGDAVGLGKTFTALAVIKYFQLKDYTVVVFCPKRLEENWTQYKEGENSCFESDGFDYLVRFHTDLQNKRLESTTIYKDFPLKKIQKKNKLLYVIDESHNFKSSGSGRYKNFVKDLLMPGKPEKDIKVLMLSATPINISLTDLANQIKLITRGDEKGFRDTLNIFSIDKVFKLAENKFKEWVKQDNHDVNQLIASINEEVLEITDKLVVARKRNFVKKYETNHNIKFPQKCPPDNHFIAIDGIGDLTNSEALYKAIEKINFSAYIPTSYSRTGSEAHEIALAGIMVNLVFKRLESSWHSCYSTLQKILEKHEQMLEFVKTKNKNFDYGELFRTDDFDDEEYEEKYQDECQDKIRKLDLSTLDCDAFINDLSRDIENLKYIIVNFEKFKNNIEKNKAVDKKLDRLASIISEKQKGTNKKLIVFTEYEDTARYIYENLIKMGFSKLACVTGNGSSTTWGYEGKKFHDLLKQFCPKAKIFNELTTEEQSNYESYDAWYKNELNNPNVSKYLKQPVDVLITTDCLSEGQNLQDSDTVVNYDIHWNPVRLIQRFGRIDRINSTNSEIKAINFWPTNDYDEYLGLRKRIEVRMAMMLVTDTETEGIKKVDDESIRNEEKLLKQLQINWDDINEDNFSLDDLSLEDFRQDLVEYLKANQKKFYKKPKGIFSSFDLSKSITPTDVAKNSLVAVLGYPRMPSSGKYKEKYLICLNLKGDIIKLNNHQILDCLRRNKDRDRSSLIDKAIDNGNQQIFNDFRKAIYNWLNEINSQINKENIDDLLTSPSIEGICTEKEIENKFKPENFDVLTWEYIS